MDTTSHITMRRAADFGSRLALDLADKLEKERINPFKWPEKFPITIKRILQLPEINKNHKVAKRANEAAHLLWERIRNDAVNRAHFFEEHIDVNEPWSWRELFMEIEQAAGRIFLTDHGTEEVAQRKVYSVLKPTKLKNFMVEFGDDYKNFIDEVRELIRAKKAISASNRFELICSLNTNTKKATKLLTKK